MRISGNYFSLAARSKKINCFVTRASEVQFSTTKPVRKSDLYSVFRPKTPGIMTKIVNYEVLLISLIKTGMFHFANFLLEKIFFALVKKNFVITRA